MGPFGAVAVGDKMICEINDLPLTGTNGLLDGRLTSRISNLSVLTLFQVFFSLATGLMFIPAEKQQGVNTPNTP